MNWVIDLFLVVLFAVTVIIYARRGFVKSFLEVFKFGLSILLTIWIAPYIGKIIYNGFMYNSIYSSVHGWLDSVGENVKVEQLAENIPNIVVSMLKNMGLDIEAILNQYQGQEATKEIIETLANTIASPIATLISNVISYIVTFILSLILLTVLAFLLNKVCNLPVLKQANTVLGIVMGLICGVLNLLIAVATITMLLNLFGNESSGITVDAMKESTFIYKHVSNFNLLELIEESITKIKSK